MFCRRIRLAVLGLLFVTITASGLWAESAAVKVHKNLISLHGPDANGMVQVTGLTGAVEFPAEDKVIVKIENLTTKNKTDAMLNPDGSFTVAVSGQPDEQIKISAANQHKKKQSYGIFSIPALLPANDNTTSPATAEQNPTTATDAPKLTEPASASAPDNTTLSGKQELAVIITVIDTRTGQTISTQRVTGTVKAEAGQDGRLSNIAKRIISRCTKVVQSEFNRPNLQPVKPAAGESGKTETENNEKLSPPVPQTDTVAPVESSDAAPPASGTAAPAAATPVK
jgi:hypothetical protein